MGPGLIATARGSHLGPCAMVPGSPIRPSGACCHGTGQPYCPLGLLPRCQAPILDRAGRSAAAPGGLWGPWHWSAILGPAGLVAMAPGNPVEHVAMVQGSPLGPWVCCHGARLWGLSPRQPYHGARRPPWTRWGLLPWRWQPYRALRVPLLRRGGPSGYRSRTLGPPRPAQPLQQAEAAPASRASVSPAGAPEGAKAGPGLGLKTKAASLILSPGSRAGVHAPTRGGGSPEPQPIV